jgi:hypothetical protein
MVDPTVSRNEKNGVPPKKRLMDVSDYPGHDLSGLSLFRTSLLAPVSKSIFFCAVVVAAEAGSY